jgi:hypothetical protein
MSIDVTGGKPHALGGNCVQPTVLTGVTSSMLVAQEEAFGPVAPLFRFKVRPRGNSGDQIRLPGWHLNSPLEE